MKRLLSVDGFPVFDQPPINRRKIKVIEKNDVTTFKNCAILSTSYKTSVKHSANHSTEMSNLSNKIEVSSVVNKNEATSGELINNLENWNEKDPHFNYNNHNVTSINHKKKGENKSLGESDFNFNEIALKFAKYDQETDENLPFSSSFYKIDFKSAYNYICRKNEKTKFRNAEIYPSVDKLQLHTSPKEYEINLDVNCTQNLFSSDKNAVCGKLKRNSVYKCKNNHNQSNVVDETCPLNKSSATPKIKQNTDKNNSISNESYSEFHNTKGNSFRTVTKHRKDNEDSFNPLRFSTPNVPDFLSQKHAFEKEMDKNSHHSTETPKTNSSNKYLIKEKIDKPDESIKKQSKNKIYLGNVDNVVSDNVKNFENKESNLTEVETNAFDESSLILENKLKNKRLKEANLKGADTNNISNDHKEKHKKYKKKRSLTLSKLNNYKFIENEKTDYETDSLEYILFNEPVINVSKECMKKHKKNKNLIPVKKRKSDFNIEDKADIETRTLEKFTLHSKSNVCFNDKYREKNEFRNFSLCEFKEYEEADAVKKNLLDESKLNSEKKSCKNNKKRKSLRPSKVNNYKCIENEETDNETDTLEYIIFNEPVINTGKNDKNLNSAKKCNIEDETDTETHTSEKSTLHDKSKVSFDDKYREKDKRKDFCSSEFKEYEEANRAKEIILFDEQKLNFENIHSKKDQNYNNAVEGIYEQSESVQLQLEHHIKKINLYSSKLNGIVNGYQTNCNGKKRKKHNLNTADFVKGFENNKNGKEIEIENIEPCTVSDSSLEIENDTEQFSNDDEQCNFAFGGSHKKQKNNPIVNENNSYSKFYKEKETQTTEEYRNKDYEKHFKSDIAIQCSLPKKCQGKTCNSALSNNYVNSTEVNTLNEVAKKHLDSVQDSEPSVVKKHLCKKKLCEKEKCNLNSNKVCKKDNLKYKSRKNQSLTVPCMLKDSSTLNSALDSSVVLSYNDSELNFTKNVNKDLAADKLCLSPVTSNRRNRKIKTVCNNSHKDNSCSEPILANESSISENTNEKSASLNASNDDLHYDSSIIKAVNSRANSGICKKNLVNDQNCSAEDMNMQSEIFFNYEEDPVDFEIPPLHIFENVTRLNKREKKKLQAAGIFIKGGKFTVTEDNIIKRNFEGFVRKYKISKPLELLGIVKCKENVNRLRFLKATHFYVRLGKDLDDRELRSIYRRAKLILNPQRNVSNFTEDEMAKLKELYTSVTNWHEISKILGKSAVSCRNTYKLHEKKISRGTFTEKEKKQLLLAIKKVTGKSDLTCKHMKGVSWEKIASYVPTRNNIQCRRYWAEHLAWEQGSKKKKWNRSCHCKLICILKKMGVKKPSMINWYKIYEQFVDFAPSDVFVQKKWLYLRSQIPDYKNKSHTKIIKLLCDKYLN